MMSCLASPANAVWLCRSAHLPLLRRLLAVPIFAAHGCSASASYVSGTVINVDGGNAPVY